MTLGHSLPSPFPSHFVSIFACDRKRARSCFDLEHKSGKKGWENKFCEFLFPMEFGWLKNEMGKSCIFKSRKKSRMTLPSSV